jgi:integrase
MRVFKRGEMYWYSFTVNGKRHRQSCETTDEDKARRVMAKHYEEAWAIERLGLRQRRTWEETLKRWLGEHEHKRTYSGDVAHGRWWSEHFAKRGITYLDQITPDVVKAIRDAKVGQQRERGGKPLAGKSVSPATVNRKIALLRAVMNAAAREYLWLDSAPLFRLMPGEVERVRFLTPPEVQRLLAALPEPYSSMALLAVATGLRQSNVLKLTWPQVDFGHRTLTFPGKLMKNGQPLTLPLTEMALQAIRPWVGRHAERVFVTDEGRPVNGVQSKMWRAALKKAGIEDFRWHDLRHTWASLMRQNGAGLAVIQELGAWQNERMVRRYAHLSVSHLAEHAAMMDRVLDPGMASRNRSEGQSFLTATGS